MIPDLTFGVEGYLRAVAQWLKAQEWLGILLATLAALLLLGLIYRILRTRRP